MAREFYRLAKKKIVRQYINHLERQAKKRIQKNEGLWNLLQEYLKKTSTVGCSYVDYWALYTFVRGMKPKEILECGTGVSTIIMAYALFENHKETGVKGRITSMEELKDYYTIASRLLPSLLEPYIEIILSVTFHKRYYLFRGVGYEKVPHRPYDLVYVDGPKTSRHCNEQKTFDFDFIDIVSRSKKPVYALVDMRLSTCWVFQHLFGKEKVKFDFRRNIGFVGPCTKEDLRTTNEIIAYDGGIGRFRKSLFFKKRIKDALRL